MDIAADVCSDQPNRHDGHQAEKLRQFHEIR